MSLAEEKKIHLPKSISTYGPTTIDLATQSEIHEALFRSGAVKNLQEQLQHALQAAPGDWPAKIEAHAKNVARLNPRLKAEGLLAQVLADIKADTDLKKQMARASADDAKNGNVKIKIPNGRDPSLALPNAVVEEALRSTKTALQEICVIDQ